MDRHLDLSGSSSSTGSGNPIDNTKESLADQQQPTNPSNTFHVADNPPKNSDSAQNDSSAVNGANGTSTDHPLGSGSGSSGAGPGPPNPKPGQLPHRKSAVLIKLRISDQAVDPHDPSFDFVAWSRTVVNLRKEVNIPTPPRSGFVFRNLTVRGSGSGIEQQDTLWTKLSSGLGLFDLVRSCTTRKNKKQTKTILQGLDGVVQKGELLLVLGRPGSGCSTFLKTVTGETQGLELDHESVLEYRGITHQEMGNQFSGELVYNQEVDQHFPYLTVSQTLEFAAAMRTPRARLPGVTRQDRVQHVVDVSLAIFGLSHARDTIVGDDYVRGVSGGERKRVSIAEAAVAGAAVSAWDNSTRGLDAESALNFVLRLRTLSDLTLSSVVAALYQSSEAITDRFDKVSVLYEGRQIFFGRVTSSSEYFEQMGWNRPARQTLGEFLTAVTNPSQRSAKKGFDHLVPRTTEEFEAHWRKSPQYASLQAEMEQYQHDDDGTSGRAAALEEFRQARRQIKAKWMLPKAPQVISFPMQTGLCAKRAYQQLWNGKAAALTSLFGEIIIALVVGSIFYGTAASTDAFFSYGSVLFFAVLLNVLMSTTDAHNLYKGRAVVRKQVSYRFYRPSADALGTVLIDIPWKFIMATCFNLTLYFLAGLAATASQFFIFFLFVFVATLAMSMVFRTVAAATKTLAQCMAISGFLVLALVTYAGFVLPAPDMRPWLKWISYINPLFYAFESLLVNQAHNTEYPCAGLVPPYPGLTGETFVCPVPGAVAGQTGVSGDAWFETSYGYSYSHLWRNLGILLGFFFFFLLTYLLATEMKVQSFVGPDVLVFLRSRGRLFSWGSRPSADGDAKLKGKNVDDVEAGSPVTGSSSPPPSLPAPLIATQLADVEDVEEVPRVADADDGETFSWQNVCLDVMVKNKSNRLLNNVSGWVRPGTLTALMGVSGAGKTTLLNALAQRVSYGAVVGDFYLDGKPLPVSFKRNVAYVQQQDLHLETSTVQEALQFSALLRQPAQVPKAEKLAFVEDLIQRLEMTEFADAVVGVAGRGLGVEQRKRLSIAVELAAKPTMLMFLDEPTSGLDGHSSEAILTLLRKLAAGGLGIICTIHQPSAMLFQQFDRLLLMAHGGRVSYFGDIGPESETVLGYFGDRGARRCEGAENPAEYLLDILQSSDTAKYDWPSLWASSTEAKQISFDLEATKKPEGTSGRNGATHDQHNNKAQRGTEYSVPLIWQIAPVFRRTLQQHWRSPTYILSKYMLGIASSLFLGFSFWKSGTTIMGVQNAIFSILMMCAVFSALVQQIMPRFLMQRTLYEVRERHSNMYSWSVMILSNILAEIPYHVVLGVIVFAIFNYTVFDIRSAEDQGLVLLFCVYFYVFAGTFAIMIMAPLPDATTAGGVVTILFSMMVLFAGVFQTPTALPGFWIFMYRVSPLTYLVGGIAAAGLSGKPIVCSSSELAVFQPPATGGGTCGRYLAPFLQSGGVGALLNPDDVADCAYCPLQAADQVLARSGIYYDDRWFDWAVGFVYIGFNIAAAFGFYYWFRKIDLSGILKKVDLSRIVRRKSK